MSAGLEPLIASAWIVQRLASSTALAAALGVQGTAGLVGRIWQGNAPLNAAQPFVVFNAQSEGNDVQGVGATSIMTDSVYTVRAVLQTANVMELADAAAAIHTSLHQQRADVTVGTIAAGTVAARRERSFYQEYADESGHPYRALGGIFQLWAATTTD
jgi:hypothetical protein